MDGLAAVLLLVIRRILLFPVTRIVIFFVFTSATATVLILAMKVAGLPRSQLRGETAAAIGSVAGLLLLGRLVERRPPSEIGFRLHHSVRQLGAGCAGGAAFMMAVTGVLALAGWYRVGGEGNPKGGALWFMAWSASVFLGVAVFEEIMSRGVIFRVIEERAGSWWALAISSTIFGAGHIGNPNAGVLAAVSIAVAAGILLGGAYMLTRTLWPAIGIHWTWNLFEGPVFDFPVSGLDTASIVRARVRGPELWTGGKFGPEAGLVVLLLGAAAGAALLAVARRQGKFLPRARRAPAGAPSLEA